MPEQTVREISFFYFNNLMAKGIKIEYPSDSNTDSDTDNGSDIDHFISTR